LMYLVVVNLSRGRVVFTPRDQSLLGLSGRDDRTAVIAKLGQPASDRWQSDAGAIQYEALGYPDRHNTVILMGSDRRSALFIGFIAARVMTLNDQRATPAERLRNGHDFEPTNKWIVFGHHFAAIAGPGPLVGPVLAAQFGYLPGTLWIIIGAVLGGAVQDFVTL